MKLETQPKNIAQMENVGNVKEFTMKATAKSFEILSSSLYSNPIRAIVRELSTNAYDSHIEAGNTNPFDIHLPTQMEPYFYIRDYGIGLTADQVENIYITYFDSNKTDNNDLVGGLGLGSKAPFSYTQNFTVTAIKNGIKSLFSAFINDDGIPSIVKMGEVSSNEPTGVEIKFAVEKDFYKFVDEAQHVYKYFSMKPNFIGKQITIPKVEYETRNVIPNLHILKNNSYNTRAVAVMGNIVYPIDVPNADKVLGPLKAYQEFAIQIDFSIGEVQFQASREGLHYTKNTIQAIGRKFKELDDMLYHAFKKDMDRFDNTWTRSICFNEKYNANKIWKNSAHRYLAEFPDKIADNTMHVDDNTFEKYNVKLESFKYDTYYDNARSFRPDITFDPYKTIFVENDTTVGMVKRIKNHIKQTKVTEKFYAIVPINNKVSIDYDGFYQVIKNPPNACKIKASTLTEMPKKDRKQTNLKNIGVLKLAYADQTSYMVDNRYKWEPHTFGNLDATQTYYYIPLSGYSPLFEKIPNNTHINIKHLFDIMQKSTIEGITNVYIYGVRKSDIEKIKDQPNWVNLEQYLFDTVNSITYHTILSSVIKKLDNNAYSKYTSSIGKFVTSPDSTYHTITKYVEKKTKSFDIRYAKTFVKIIGSTIDLGKITEEAEATANKFLKVYPILKLINNCDRHDYNTIAEYINFIDMKKE